MRTLASTIALMGAALAAVPGVAHAQGALVHGSVAAAVSNGTTSPSFGGGVTYRFNRWLGLGVELNHLSSLETDFPRLYSLPARDGQSDGRATVFTTNVRLEIPTTSTRIIPFVVGGGGVGSVTDSYGVVYAALADLIPPGISVLPGPQKFENTTTSMALTLSGGASFLLNDHLAVDANLGVLHLTGNSSRNIGRFGGGVSYRF